MVGYDCPYCGGLKEITVLTMRWGEVRETKEPCRHCNGGGSLWNGAPESNVSIGITDDDPAWRTKWENYDEQRQKGIDWLKSVWSERE